MNKEKKEYVINHLKWPLNHFDYFSNYFILPIPILTIYIGATEFKRVNSLTLLISGILILIFIVYRIEAERKFKKLTFTEDLSTKEIGELLKKNE